MIYAFRLKGSFHELRRGSRLISKFEFRYEICFLASPFPTPAYLRQLYLSLRHSSQPLNQPWKDWYTNCTRILTTITVPAAAYAHHRVPPSIEYFQSSSFNFTTILALGNPNNHYHSKPHHQRPFLFAVNFDAFDTISEIKFEITQEGVRVNEVTELGICVEVVKDELEPAMKKAKLEIEFGRGILLRVIMRSRALLYGVGKEDTLALETVIV
ncbi:hypothetical protein L1887_15218 [Cichorium endivia]|nr:hypothetical protein L1887_15218 [Cichorium endivia]